MVYDNTAGPVSFESGIAGYAIHDTGAELAAQLQERRYSLYTDDGKGNGDFVCDSDDLYMIRRIAAALDSFDYDERMQS